jgi:AcrR family transcriptional regulator
MPYDTGAEERERLAGEGRQRSWWKRFTRQMTRTRLRTARGRRVRVDDQESPEAAPEVSPDVSADDADCSSPGMIGMIGAKETEEAEEAEEAALSELEQALAPVIEPPLRIPRQARSLRTRDGLLRAAETLFTERGYARVTADDIAAAAGVSVGAFYNYYRNKRQILIALAQKRLSDIFAHLRLARMDLTRGDHHTVIREAVASVIASDQRSGLRGVWQQLMSLEPELAPCQAAIRRYALGLLERQLQSARESGDLWPDLDIEGTALAIFAMLDALSARRDHSLTDERLIESVTILIERTLFQPSQPD